ncbi:MAG: hypothetical protein ACOCP1_00440 [Campylobacterales bacterium]
MPEDDVIILEDDDEKESPKESKLSKLEFLKKRKKLTIIGAVVLLLMVVLVILLFIFLPSQDSSEEDVEGLAQNLREIEDQRNISISKLDKMIEKANILYERGIKGDALKIYEKIAGFSESVSFYNLGVARMKEDDYEGAIKAFQTAINAGEDRCVSALNAAASALYLDDKKLFSYYVDLAHAFLKDESNSPLYSYYYALVMYYKDNFFESFSPLLNRSSQFYDGEQNHILANLYTLYGDNQKAINSLERNIEGSDYLHLGLLYAREGMYDLAARNIVSAIDDNNSSKASVALELVDLKRGFFQDASSSLNRLISDGVSTNDYYPIRAKLSESLFDIDIAQQRFAKDFDLNDINSLKILFYFVNYMVFDAESIMKVIQKGGLNIYIDEIEDAKELLLIGGTVSQVNYNIALALEEVLKKDLRKANRILLEMTDKYKNHAVLHFNLALSYAQLGDYEKAYFHFLKSYHLDSHNIMGGVYAIATAKITNRDYGKILDGVTEDLDRIELSGKRKDFIITMINFIEANPVSVINWADEDNTQNPLHISVKALSSYSVGDMDRFGLYVDELKELLPDDLIVGIFDLISKNAEGENISEFSLASQEFFRTNKYNLDGLYFGAAIARELYIRLAYITGAINYVKKEIEQKVQTYSGDGRGPLQALSFVNIYTRNFEEAFVGYTTLIDNLDVKDSRTLFLGAVAAIGSGHHENAAANLELSILNDRRNYESRYALGLLYQEADNLKGASAQFGVMGNSGFESEYFDFSIESNTRRDSGF